MPTYEYQCKACDHRYERFQRMTEDPDSICPICQGEIHRVIFPAGVIFKGSGFYVTDSRKSANGESSTSNGDAKGGESQADAPAEAKGEAKKESPASSTKESASNGTSSKASSDSKEPAGTAA